MQYLTPRAILGLLLHAALIIVGIVIGKNIDALMTAKGWDQFFLKLYDTNWSKPMTGLAQIGIGEWGQLSLAFLLGSIVVFWVTAFVLPRENAHGPSWQPYWEENRYFKLREAAFLWIGVDPTDGIITPGSRANTVLEMLREAIRDGRFKMPDHFRANINIDADIARDIYRDYAKTLSRRARPKFKF